MTSQLSRSRAKHDSSEYSHWWEAIPAAAAGYEGVAIRVGTRPRRQARWSPARTLSGGHQDGSKRTGGLLGLGAG